MFRDDPRMELHIARHRILGKPVSIKSAPAEFRGGAERSMKVIMAPIVVGDRGSPAGNG